MSTPTPSQLDGYVKLNGSFVYCDDDSQKKCVDASKVCSSRDGMMGCGNWWNYGYWTGWWNWSYYYGFLGDNLIFLYNEIDAPDEYLCVYPRTCGIFAGNAGWGWWFGFGGQYCSEDIGDCNYPRIKNCKRSNCVYGTYSGYFYGYGNLCAYINGKDREDRCCKKPEDFTCKEGECDYDYEIVKKSYSIEYELVKPSYFCNDPPPNPGSSCDGSVAVVTNKCYQFRTYCGPKNKCPSNSGGEPFYWCNPDDPASKPSKGYTEVAEEPYQVIWDYPPKDCNTKCTRCIPCSEDDCNFAWYDSYNWGWGGWSYFNNNIGTDCCDSWTGLHSLRPQLCPSTIIDDGSGNPWWCSGTDCVQMEEGEETVGLKGPFSSRVSCLKECNEDTNKCIPPDPAIIRDLCCDKKFMEQLEKALEEGCSEQVNRTSRKAENVLCTGTSCQDRATFKYTKELCGYKPKFIEAEKSIHTRSYKLYEYSVQVPKKNFADFISCQGAAVACDEDSYAKCRADFAAVWGNNDCPSNTQRNVSVQTLNFNPQQIVGTATISVVAVFCKITTKKCVPSEEEEEET